MRTSMAMCLTLLWWTSDATSGTLTGPRSFRRAGDLDGFLGDNAVGDAVGAELRGGQLLAGGHQHVVRLRLIRVGDVGPRRVGLGGGVRVVDHHRFLVAL